MTTAAGAPVDHHVLAWIETPGLDPAYLPLDAPVLDASKFQTFRVRFQVHNIGATPITAIPRLESRADGAAAFAVVPENSQSGIAFHVAREWVPSLDIDGGTMQGPLGENIAAADLKMPSTIGVAAIGHHSTGANPDASMTLPAASYTEEEFTVQLTMDAQYLTGYDLRITDAGAEITGATSARIVLGSPPPLELSPGQRQGLVVDAPAAMSPAGAAYPLLSAPSVAADTTPATQAATAVPSGALYPLASGSLSPAIVATSSTVAVISANTTGGPHDMAQAQCGICHKGHTAQASSLLAQSQQSTLCFSCHDGSGTAKDVKSPYADPSRPSNVLAAREYYSHDALDSTASTLHSLEPDEFGGKANRHSTCADCHNSHKANSTDSVQSSDGTGWDASGRLAGVSGVAVLNGVAGSAPTYTFLSGHDTNVVPANLVTREYQLCFKCHSGSTILPPPIAGKPSKDFLDKGVEFNPANASYHPVEAKGKNQSTKMADSLAGTSPYKLWNFTIGSTIRCLNCHASGSTPGATPPLPPPGDPTLPKPGSALAPHTSSNRGILLRNYKDRVLKTTNAAYSAGDFALCFVCHAEEPFKNESSTVATNFSVHGYHLTKLTGMGSANTDIDLAGAGGGNAICAECHFRIHSTTNKVGQPGGAGLVSFAPNVEPFGTTLSWTRGTTGSGSCTLTCHGKQHDGKSY